MIRKLFMGKGFRMDVKIIYLTNDGRRYAAMKDSCLMMQEQGKISDLCMPVKMEK